MKVQRRDFVKTLTAGAVLVPKLGRERERELSRAPMIKAGDQCDVAVVDWAFSLRQVAEV